MPKDNERTKTVVSMPHLSRHDWTLALTGLVLGVTVNRKWLAVPGIVLPFLLQHGIRDGARRFR